MDISQEFGIFHKSTEVELITSKMDMIFVKIQFHFKTCPRSQNREGRQFKQETRLESRCRKGQ